jgi:DEAD/DEAH box helicase
MVAVRAFTAAPDRHHALLSSSRRAASSSLSTAAFPSSSNNSRPTLSTASATAASPLLMTSSSTSSSYRHGAWNRATRLASTSFPASRTASVLEEEDDNSDDDEEDDLDAALDGILGQASSTPSSSAAATTRRITVQHSPMPAPLVEEDVDWTSGDAATKELLFTGNPRWIAAGLNPAIIDVLSSRGITHFTPVQAEAFAPVLARRDVIGRSRTGTGKTLAFGLPSITRLLDFMVTNGKRDQNSGQMRRGRTPSMLVLCPTRELARQVSDELAAVAKPVGLFVEVFHGGVSYDPQARALRTGVDIIVGTPGRIIDHLNRGNMDLTECDIVVLDEADEMLNMGFSEDVEVRIDSRLQRALFDDIRNDTSWSNQTYAFLAPLCFSARPFWRTLVLPTRRRRSACCSPPRRPTGSKISAESTRRMSSTLTRRPKRAGRGSPRRSGTWPCSFPRAPPPRSPSWKTLLRWKFPRTPLTRTRTTRTS